MMGSGRLRAGAAACPAVGHPWCSVARAASAPHRVRSLLGILPRRWRGPGSRCAVPRRGESAMTAVLAWGETPETARYHRVIPERGVLPDGDNSSGAAM